MQLIVRSARCAVLGAAMGTLLAMMFAVAYAAPMHHLNGGMHEQPRAVSESAVMRLRTPGGGMWTLDAISASYSVGDVVHAFVWLDDHGLAAFRHVALDAYDNAIWAVTTRDTLVRIDASGTVDVHEPIAAGASALAIGLDQRPWVTFDREIVGFRSDGKADLRILTPRVAGVIGMVVDSLRNRLVIASAADVLVVSLDDYRMATLVSSPRRIQSIEVHPMSGQLWILAGEHVDRYSSEGGIVGSLDLRSFRQSDDPFVAIAYDADSRAMIVATAGRSITFDELGRSLPGLTLTGLVSSMRPTPLRVEPAIVDVEVGAELIDVRVGARCNHIPCDLGSGYTATANITATLDGGPFAMTAPYDLMAGQLYVPSTIGGTLSIQAMDRFGHRSEPSTLTLTAGRRPTTLKANQAPAVSMTSPVNNATFVPGSNITLAATATDGDGSIAKVEFLRGGTLIGTVQTPPYSFVWSAVPAGSYGLTARATDDRGATKTSSTVNIVVRAPPNVAPTIAVTSPAAGSIVNGPAVTINTTARDSDGVVSKVEYFEGTRMLASVAGSSPIAEGSWTYREITSGPHTIKATATDNAGAVASASVTFNVNAAPFAVVTSPLPCSEVGLGANVTLAADAFDPDGTVSRVEFYVGTALIGTSAVAPYRYVWPTPPAGRYTITAVAIDNRGARGVSNPVAVAVRTPNVLPTVLITSPSSGSRFGSVASIPIAATASDTDGSVRRVDFYSGTTLIGSASASPFTITWRADAVGKFTLTARAVDDRGGVVTSNAVAIETVVNAQPRVSITAPPDYTVLAKGETVMLEAEASDVDGVVRKVEFFVGDYSGTTMSLLGTATAAPYRVPFTMDRDGGGYKFVARATDDLGGSVDSFVRSIVGNTPPAIVVTYPVSGARLLPGESVQFRARDSDPEGNNIAGYAEVWADGSMIYEAPAISRDKTTHELIFRPFFAVPSSAMEATLIARAVDSKGAESRSAPVRFDVVPVAAVTLLTPARDEFVAPSGSVKLSASASQPYGRIVRVDYYADNVLIGSSTTPPYDFTWTQLPFTGSTTEVLVRAHAVDNLGSAYVGQSSNVKLTIEPMRVEFDAAVVNTTVNEASTVVKGTYSGGTPTSIMVTVGYRGAESTYVATFSNGHFEVTIPLEEPSFQTIPGVGVVEVWPTHDVRVAATTSAGQSVRNTTIRRARPSGTLEWGPQNPLAPASIDLSVRPRGFAKAIERVEYWWGKTLVATAVSEPWRAGWNVATPGSYDVVAKIINADATVVATGPTIVVSPGVGVSISDPKDLSEYRLGATVSIQSFLRAPEGRDVGTMDLLMNGEVIASNAGTNVTWYSWTAHVDGMPIGIHTFAVRMTDTTGEQTMSNAVRVRVASGQVRIATPAADTWFATGSSIRITAAPDTGETRTGSVEFFANGRLIGLDFEPLSMVWADVPDGDYELTARAYNGNTPGAMSAPVRIRVTPVAVNVDRPGDRDEVFDDFVTIGGTYAAADPPQSIVVNGVPATKANGLYAARIPVNAGSNVITVAVQANGQTAHREIQLTRSQPAVAVSNIQAGDVIRDDTVMIRGTVNAPANSSVLINGRPVILSSTGSFFDNNFPLAPGANTLTVRLMQQDDTYVDSTLNVTRNGRQPFTLSMSPADGFQLPHRALVTLETRKPAVDYSRVRLVQGAQIVFDESVSGDKSFRQYLIEFSAFGVTEVQFQLLDQSDRVVYSRPLVSNVRRPEELDAEIRAVYRDTLNRILAGDLASATTAYEGDLRSDYQTMFRDLGPKLQELVEMYRNVGSVDFSTEVAEMTIRTPDAGPSRGTSVGLSKDATGIWRISGM